MIVSKPSMIGTCLSLNFWTNNLKHWNVFLLMDKGEIYGIPPYLDFLYGKRIQERLFKMRVLCYNIHK